MAGFETDLTQCAGGSLVLGIIATAQLVGCGLVALTLFQAKDRCRHCCGFSPFWRRGTPLFFVLVSQVNMAHLRQISKSATSAPIRIDIRSHELGPWAREYKS